MYRIRKLITFGVIFITSLTAYSQSLNELSVCKKLLQDTGVDTWENSFRGGYVCKFDFDIDGDNVREKFIMFTMESQYWYVFHSGENGGLIGRIRSHLTEGISANKIKGGLSFINTYLNYGKSDSKAIIEQRLTAEGVRVIEITGDDVDLDEFDRIEEAETTQQYTPVKITYTTLEDYLSLKPVIWKNYRQEDWTMVDTYDILDKDTDLLSKTKLSETDEEVGEIIGTFTEHKALDLLAKKKDNLLNIAPNKIEESQDKLWVYIFGGLLLIIIIISLLKKKSKVANS